MYRETASASGFSVLNTLISSPVPALSLKPYMLVKAISLQYGEGSYAEKIRKKPIPPTPGTIPDDIPSWEAYGASCAW